ncbi:putative methyltransferase PMT19 [Apostasia shenzhenica]|uniref:Methyltransferase n=1 Tax=Apostasia shenzhenica TaxID=1088818 RepID=A0A2I0AUT6_9ASPA|nr:putative methyltransferase PMT19 [Apostasia shenzhenica]
MLGGIYSSLLPSPSAKTLAIASVASLLCILSYLLGAHRFSFSPPSPFSSTRLPCPNPPPVYTPSSSASLEFLPRHSAADAIPLPADSLSAIPFCSTNFTHYCPCQDPNRERLVRHFSRLERHCPSPADRPSRCRVPHPHGYRAPVPWPDSRRSVWFANVPFKTLTVAKADQNWVRIEGDKLVFPGGGTSFPHGVEWYVGKISKVVPLRTGEVRTVLDIGCGVASFGNHLLDYNVLTMSVAPRDVHEAQVQFALERGLPAMLGVLGIFRLPYPSRSFDMVHCARCLIKWASREGLYLLEIDRILRPGGYWVLSGPPINWKKMYKGWERTAEDLEAEQIAIEDLAKRLCWKKIAEKAPIAVWRKPKNHIHCAVKLKLAKSLGFCEKSDPDTAWYDRMQVCLTRLPMVEEIHDTAGGALAKWPKRLNVVPPRISNNRIKGVSTETFHADGQIWNKRVLHYRNYFNLGLAVKYRNIMDMNAGLGGFAAALGKYPVWVLNVVPVHASIRTLDVIYERGLIGTYMDWCEAFSTYPRTYDLIHANGIFSIYMDKCEMIDILLEMDRILRPEGAVIIRDHVDIIVKAKNEAERLGWQCRMVHGEGGPFHEEKLLIVDNSIKVNATRS